MKATDYLSPDLEENLQSIFDTEAEGGRHCGTLARLILEIYGNVCCEGNLIAAAQERWPDFTTTLDKAKSAPNRLIADLEMISIMQIYRRDAPYEITMLQKQLESHIFSEPESKGQTK